MNRNIFIISGVVVAVGLVYLFFGGSSEEVVEEIFVEVRKGDFQISVTTTGELEAKNSVDIMGPDGLRQARLYNVKINDMVIEGTVVKKGDYIAMLDKSELNDRLSQVGDDLEKVTSEYIQTKMDTALELRKARDNLINLEFDVEEKEIIVEQSKFEPQATQRQNEINLQKAKRQYQQAIENYQLQKNKARAQMREKAAVMSKYQRELDFLLTLSENFKVTAPEPGMVIYRRHWRGGKLGVGSTISPWEPVVATLPDLTKMVSKTFVNEVDIRSIGKGQKASIGLDAFPDKALTGEVVEVANIGEQKPNSDSKVFQVLIEINEMDTTLRPAMTTSNLIISEVIENVLYAPLESVHSQGDSLSYVIKKNTTGYIKQEVVLGKTNSNEIIISDGVDEGDELYLSVPSGVESASIVLLEEKEAITAK